MLQTKRIRPTLPAADMERAKKFYKDKLGFTPSGENPGGVVYDCANGTGFLLYPSPNAGKCPTTYAAWETDDLEAEVKELKSKEVVFEEYDMPGLKTVDSIAQLGPDKAAWFKDSEGNILGIFQMGMPDFSKS